MDTKAKVAPSDCTGKWGNAATVCSGAEEKADPWGSKGGNDNIKIGDGWGIGSSGASWDKPSFSLGGQEPAWGKPRIDDGNNGNSRGRFGCGNRGRGVGHSFGDSLSSWNGGNSNDESGGGRSENQWNMRNFDGIRTGRGCFGRGGHNQGNNFWSDDGGSWGSGRGNSEGGGFKNWNDNNERRFFGQGSGWASDWNINKGTSEGDQDFSKSKPCWGSDNNDNPGAPKSSDGDNLSGKNDGNNTWSKNRSSAFILALGKERHNDTWESSTVSSTGAEDNGGSWNSKAKDSSCGGGAEEWQNDPWANKTGSNEGKEQEIDPWKKLASKVSSTAGADGNNDSWCTKAKVAPSDWVGKWGNAAPVNSGAEEKSDPWGSKGGNHNMKLSDGWGAGSSGASWDKPIFSLGDQEPVWGKPRFNDDNNGNNVAPVSSGAEEKADPWCSKRGNYNMRISDDWGAGSSGSWEENNEDSWGSSGSDSDREFANKIDSACEPSSLFLGSVLNLRV